MNLHRRIHCRKSSKILMKLMKYLVNTWSRKMDLFCSSVKFNIKSYNKKDTPDITYILASMFRVLVKQNIATGVRRKTQQQDT